MRVESSITDCQIHSTLREGGLPLQDNIRFVVVPKEVPRKPANGQAIIVFNHDVMTGGMSKARRFISVSLSRGARERLQAA